MVDTHLSVRNARADRPVWAEEFCLPLLLNHALDPDPAV